MAEDRPLRSNRLLLVLTLCAPSLTAQRAHQLELGGYAAGTRYDHLMDLRWRIGAGVRLGYFLTNGLGVELEGNFTQPRTQAPLVFTTVRWASASVVLNVRAGRNIPYLLGGYTRIQYGGSTDAPYDFGDHAIHGAVGDRITLIQGVSLRLEGRAIFAPRTDPRFGGSWAGHFVGSAGVSMFALGGPRRVGDADRDRVRDAVDACPGTPPGMAVDSRGCPQDSDGDAVANGVDSCPNTPAGAQVDRTGCPLDGDRDGVADGNDQCTATPAGAAVDARGCTLDADGDGVADALDRCASTARGMVVDAAGCPAANVDLARVFGVMRGVSFEAGGSTLTQGSYVVLNDIAAALIAHPEIRVEIAAYTDDSGVPGTIVRMTQQRAEVVRSYLAGRGVASARMVSRGYGSANPVASNATPAGRAQNRRVELRRLP
ncbi:MAG TPA: OmpA family protein [Gemmatimonadales bacterium]|nr:OmpA family protein [Gemmatimonadales bacterium]